MVHETSNYKAKLYLKKHFMVGALASTLKNRLSINEKLSSNLASDL